MKKIVRLTESDLVRLVNKVIKEESKTDRNNPRWIKLFNVLKGIGNPKVLTFKDFDGKLSQSLNWGTTKQRNANYALAIDDASEEFKLFSDNNQLEKALYQWWANKGYQVGDRDGSVKINFDDVNKIAVDLQNFIKSFPPEGKITKLAENDLGRLTKRVIAESQAESLAQMALDKAKDGQVDESIKKSAIECIKSNNYRHLSVLTTGAGAFALGAICALFVSGVGTVPSLILMAAGAGIMTIEGLMTGKDSGTGSVTEELQGLHACLKGKKKI
jgi:hypothetical protein